MWSPVCDLIELERPTLRNFLLRRTSVHEICIITENGYNSASCYIDSEDLFIGGIPGRLLGRRVKEDHFDQLVTHTGEMVQAHFIELED